MQAAPTHHFRFYLVMVTLVVVGIFFLLLTNNGEDKVGLITSSAIKSFGGEGALVNSEVEASADEIEKDEQVFLKSISNSNEVDVKLTSDAIPTISKKTKIKDMQLTFDDLTTKININNDKLELNNLKEVVLIVKGFEGNADINDEGISLDGIAKRIEVNGVTLSSKGEIKLSFKDLDYQLLMVDEIELESLELPNSNGVLDVAEKLSYTLEQDQVSLYHFNGMLQVDKNVGLILEGVAGGVRISGLLDIDLR
jgi:hypothetical protein